MTSSFFDVPSEILENLFAASEELRRQVEAAKVAGSRTGCAAALSAYREFATFSEALLNLDIGKTLPDKTLYHLGTRGDMALYSFAVGKWEVIFKKDKTIRCTML